MGGSAIPDTKPSPRGEGGERNEPDRGTSGMKESGKDRLKCAINESTLSTAGAVPLPQWRRQRGGGFAAKKEANPAIFRNQ